MTPRPMRWGRIEVHADPTDTRVRRVVMCAPAKVNLYLGVGARRDDGYHDVETILHTVGLADTVVLERGRGVGFSCDVDLGVPPEDNLAVRAARALADRLGIEPDVRIGLTKRIPAGAGLGGASSDAAAVLAGLPVLWGIDVDPALLSDVAAGLGADVPFLLTGATALYDGRGDRHVRDVPAPSLALALVRCPEPVPTAAAYAAFDAIGGPAPPGPAGMLAACESGDARRVAGALFNNMIDAAAEIVPAIASAIEWCSAAPGVLGCTLSGSGSAVFAVCEDATAAVRVAKSASMRGYWSVATRSDEVGVRLVGEGSCG